MVEKSKLKIYIYKYLKIPYLFVELIKIKLLQYFPITKDLNNKAASEFSYYPEFCLKAALNQKEFKTFRRHPKYTSIVETISKDFAQKYLDIIHKKYNLKNDEILKIINPIQNLGMPKKFFLRDLEIEVSGLALRYLKVALEIKEKIRKKDKINIVEIGCGFGGQALILDKLLDINTYSFIDIWQANLLIRRFLHDAFFDKPYSLLTLNDLISDNLNYDFLISNYAFSELPFMIQKVYFEKVVKNSKEGYMIMNSGEKGEYGTIKNLSKKELTNKIENSYIDEEYPKTSQNNYLIRW